MVGADLLFERSRLQTGKKAQELIEVFDFMHDHNPKGEGMIFRSWRSRVDRAMT